MVGIYTADGVPVDDVMFVDSGEVVRQVNRTYATDPLGVATMLWEKVTLTLHTLTLSTPGQFDFILPVATSVAFTGKGARGSQGSRIQASGIFGGVGGAGGTMVGSFAGAMGQRIRGYVGAKGEDVNAEPYGRGGEPGGACSQQNIFSQPYSGLGGVGGGYTGLWADEVIRFIIGGGGGGGCRGGAGALGGVGGGGGSTTGGGGGDGVSTNVFDPTGAGKAAGGGTQTQGGAGGIGGHFTNGQAASIGRPGRDLGGGTTFRLGNYGQGLNRHTCGGGGGGGWFGGGGGGNGTAASGNYGGGGGGGGGSSWFDAALVAVTTNTRATNSGDHGSLVLQFMAPSTWSP